MGTNHAQRERAELCDRFDQLGPDAPTLCEGWTTADLAAHLVVRERRPDAALGILSSFAERHGESVRADFARRPFTELVELVRSGPPTLSLFGLPGMDRLANTMEFFIHHEDVRRCSGDGPRRLDRSLEDQLWSSLRFGSKMMMRSSPVGIELRTGDGRSARARSGSPAVVITGAVGELALFAYGRQGAAEVHLDGPEDAVATVISASFGV